MNIKVGFIGNAQKEYEELVKIVEHQKQKGIKKSIEQQLLRSIIEKSKLIVAGINNRRPYGEKIQAKDIPKQLAYVNHLWKVRLTQYWRMLYTIDSQNRPEILAIIIEILDHDRYNKLFKRKG